MALIKIEDLNFSYNGSVRNILNHINLEINEGDFVLLCGPSGCGKTTLLKHIKHLIAPEGLKKGKLRMDDISYDDIPERVFVSDIGFVFQHPDSQIVHDKPFAEMAFGLENLGYSSDEIRRRVAEMASFFGMESFFEKDIHTLSGGQKQLLNLASVMVMQPKLLLLDEPISQLDPISTEDFLFALERLNKELGLTILICEHRLESLYSMADKVCLMDNGSVVCYDTPNLVADVIFQNNDRMKAALPVPARLYDEICPGDKRIYPFTVKEGRAFLRTLPRKETVNVTAAQVMQKKKLFEAKHVYYRYEKNLPDVLRDISFFGCENEIFSIVGGNGVGKTTLISLLCRIKRPYRGKIKINSEKSPAYLPQNPLKLFLKDTIREDFHYLLSMHGLNPSQLKKLMEQYPFFEGMEKLFASNPLDLSGGELQKLAFMKILLLEPDIILLDEPTKGLDAYAKNHLSSLLNELKQEGRCIVMVTHDLEFAAENSDRCAMMFRGEMVSTDTPENFFSDNQFYTTAAAKISKNLIPKAVTVKDVMNHC